MTENKEAETIQLIVKAQDQEKIRFKIKKDTPLKKLMDKYCERLGLGNSNQVNFIYDGQKINSNWTAERLGMQENDEIEVVTAQIGGAF